MATKNNTTQEFAYEIVEHIADLSISPSGWVKQINAIRWGSNPETEPKIDIRSWKNGKMTRGMSLHPLEAKALVEALQDRFYPSRVARPASCGVFFFASPSQREM